MPSPIGHALGGLIVSLVFGSGRSGRSRGWGASRRSKNEPNPTDQSNPTDQTYPTDQTDLTATALAACLPDIDFLWGRHNMETHSLGFAALVGLAVWAWRRDRRLAAAGFLAVCTHVLFDWLGSDDFPPLGIMALWPLTSQFYFAHAFIFDAISRRYWLPGFVEHNVVAVLREIAILTPVAAALWWWREKTN